jgi:hypothetical protein
MALRQSDLRRRFQLLYRCNSYMIEGARSVVSVGGQKFSIYIFNSLNRNSYLLLIDLAENSFVLSENTNVPN